MIWIIGSLAAWWIVSQVIAWMITPGQSEDEVVQSWFVVFMSPILLLIALVMALEVKWRNLVRRFDVFGILDR